MIISEELSNKVKIVFYLSVIVLIFTAFLKEKLPDKREILSQLYNEPAQTETKAQPFTVEAKGISYIITPVYHYELYGLIVSYHHSNEFFDYYHEQWQDFINSADLCVIWGKNIENEIYKKMKFTSGSWTCYTEFSDNVAPADYSKYCPSCLSNNHVLAQTAAINREILRAKRGDQIYAKGYLVKYAKTGMEKYPRASSVTRTDNGCEVIYVQDFKILKEANSFWRMLHALAKFFVLACIVFFIVKFFNYAVSQ